MTWKAIRENRENILQNYQKILDENKNFSENTTIISQNNSQKNTATIVSVTDGDTIKVQNPE